MIQVVTHNESKYAGIVSIKEYGNNTSAGMLDSFYNFLMNLLSRSLFNLQIGKWQLRKCRYSKIV